MKKYILTSALAVTLAGCASTPAPAPVAIPVSSCPALPALPPKPALPLETLPKGATASQTIEALTQSLAVCTRYSRALETYIDALK